MRNHNLLGAISQEPYALGPIVLEASRVSLQLRYSILKFYYSLFVKNNGQGSVFRPLFFDFHQEDDTLLGLQNQFLIGSELMVTSVGYEALTGVGVYFPAGATWYDFFTGAVVFTEGNDATNITVDAPLNGTLPVFIKAGTIVHTQNVNNVLNTTQLDNVFNLVVALNQTSQSAHGEMLGIADYLNDNTVDECMGENDCLIILDVSSQTQSDESIIFELDVSGNTGNTLLETIYFGNVTFYGVGNSNVTECTVASPYTVQFGKVQFEVDTNMNCQILSNVEMIQN